MTLFTVGPVMMFPEVLEGSGIQLPYFRTSEFSDLMLDSEALLKDLLGASSDSKVAFLTSSGTGAMEAAVINFFDESDRLLIVNGGGFGHRFCEICDVHGIPFDTVDLEFGESLTSDHLDRFGGKGYSGLMLNMDETSTGQLYDIEIVSQFCKREGMYLVVDAISSFLADPLNMEWSGIDAVILSSQKSLALAPGISVVVMNKRIFDERVRTKKPRSYYFDLGRHVSDMVRGQTPFTPAVGILLDLNRMLHLVKDRGVDSMIQRTAYLAEYFRSRVTDLGLNVPEYRLSNAVTPIIFDDGDAYDVYLKLRERYGITVTPSGGNLRDRMLRVGHIGNLCEKDYDELISALRELIN